MAWKRYSDEDILKLLSEIEMRLADGDEVRLACRGVGVGAPRRLFNSVSYALSGRVVESACASTELHNVLDAVPA